MLFFSEAYFYKLAKRYLFPTIHHTRVEEKDINFAAAVEEQNLCLAGDGQYDSQGFSAKYVTYTIMNLSTSKILDFIIVQRGMMQGKTCL